MNLSLKSVKIHQGASQETLCFSAKLYRDRKKIADVWNHGQGAPNEYHFINSEVRQEVEEWAAAQPLEFDFDKLDQVVDRMVANIDMANQLAKVCRKGLAYRLKTDKSDEWRMTGQPYTPELAMQYKERHGDNLDMIAQERLAELRLPTYAAAEV